MIAKTEIAPCYVNFYLRTFEEIDHYLNYTQMNSGCTILLFLFQTSSTGGPNVRPLTSRSRIRGPRPSCARVQAPPGRPRTFRMY